MVRPRRQGSTATRFVLAVYDIDRAWGGPEEGGWWYDTGAFVRVIGCFFDETAAIRAERRANRLLDRLQRGRTPVCSIAYRGGRHRAYIFDDLPPPAFPGVRPTYA